MKPLPIIGMLVAGVIAVTLHPGHADAGEVGRFQIAAQANTGNVWMVDTSTGVLRLCLPPKRAEQMVVECSAWTGAKRPRTVTFKEATKSK